jgi:hypothetical protein
MKGRPAKVHLFDGSPAWLVTRMEDLKALLVDNRFSKAGGRRAAGGGRRALGEVGTLLGISHIMGAAGWGPAACAESIDSSTRR